MGGEPLGRNGGTHVRTRRIVAAIAVVVGVLLLFGLLGGGLVLWPGMMHYGFGYGYGYGVRFLPWIGLGALLFRALLIGLGLLLLFELLHRRQPTRVEAGTGASRPIEILMERYARGEINKEQYDQMRRDLESR
jgi:putative membrane protein